MVAAVLSAANQQHAPTQRDVQAVLQELREVESLLAGVRQESSAYAILVGLAQSLHQTLQEQLQPLICGISRSAPDLAPFQVPSTAASLLDGFQATQPFLDLQAHGMIGQTAAPATTTPATAALPWQLQPEQHQAQTLAHSLDLLSAGSYGSVAPPLADQPAHLTCSASAYAGNPLLSTPSVASLPPVDLPLLLPTLHSPPSLSDLAIAYPAPASAGIRMSSDVHAMGMLTQLNPPMVSQGQAATFIPLTNCTWDQDVSCLKIHVPLRGVHNDMIRTKFSQHSVEVKIYNLQGCNYIFRVAPTFRPIHAEACYAVASKTKKNVLLTIKKLSSSTKEDKHWRDLQALYAPGL
ncbi:hypothetical protein WJX73_008553 [Symbiochloris irregularis]|uniref:CS domain-containing protein n=1 Tax=Symbiochloris irregularis TaxID=706552 RepID=A0AAW1PST2_9CHLO